MKNIPTIIITCGYNTCNEPMNINTNIPNTGNSYPSNNQDCENDKEYSGNSGGFDTSSNYGLHNLKDLPRIASDTEFAATCHGSIAVNSIIDHAINRNSLGHGANALASLKKVNLGYNNLNDEGIMALNKGLYGYTLNLQTFNLSYNNMGAVGLDHLIKGAIGIDHLRSGGNDIHNTMQGIFTLPTTSIVNLNLCNNNIGDVGSEILSHALVNAKLPATKSIDVSGNNITEKGEAELSSALTSTPNESLSITIEKHSNASGVWNFLKKGFKYYTEALAVKTKGNGETAVAIYGQDDWAYCKKIMVDFQREVSVGFIKHTNDVLVKQLMQKAPDKVKKATVGAVFVVASVDAALGVDVENLAYCIAAINKKAGSMLDSLTGTHNDTYFSPELIGSNGETEDF